MFGSKRVAGRESLRKVERFCYSLRSGNPRMIAPPRLGCDREGSHPLMVTAEGCDLAAKIIKHDSRDVCRLVEFIQRLKCDVARETVHKVPALRIHRKADLVEHDRNRFGN